MAAIQTTGFTVSMDGVADSGIYFINHDKDELMTATTMGDGISYNPTTDRVSKAQEVEISNIQILEYEETDVNHVDYNKPELPPCIEGYDVVLTHSKTETGGTGDIICSTISTPEEYEAAKARENGIKVYSYGVDMAFENVYYNEYANPKSFTFESMLMDKMPADAQGPIYGVKIILDKSGKLIAEWGWYDLS